MTDNTTYDEAAARASLYKKLARVMGQLDRLPKTGHNKHFDYKFATDADVSDAIRGKLAEEGIAFYAEMVTSNQEPVTRETKYGVKTTIHTIAHFAFTFADADTGATVTTTWSGESMDEQDKGLNKAATAALKYFLLKTFMLSTGDPKDDPDTDADLGEVVPQPWNQNKNRVIAFVDRMNERHNMTADDMLAALGVSRFGEYKGDEAAAEAAVMAWVSRKAVPAPKSDAVPDAESQATAGAPDTLEEVFPRSDPTFDRADLQARTKHLFNAPKHFDNWYKKHGTELTGMGIDEAVGYVEAANPPKMTKADIDSYYALAKGRFGMVEGDVVTAVQRAQRLTGKDMIGTLSEYVGDKMFVSGAIVAAGYKWDAAAVGQLYDGNPGVKAIAQMLCNAEAQRRSQGQAA